MKEQLPIIPANARKLHNIEFLAGLDAQLIQGQKILEPRLRQIPGAWRNFRLAVSCVEKVIEGVYDTLPTRTLQRMDKLARFGQIIIRPKPLIKMPDDVQIVQTDDLKLLINAAIAAECAVCLKDAKAQKKCMLRRALENIAPTAAVHENGLCAYTDVAVGNPFGEYI